MDFMNKALLFVLLIVCVVAVVVFSDAFFDSTAGTTPSSEAGEVASTAMQKKILMQLVLLNQTEDQILEVLRANNVRSSK